MLKLYIRIQDAIKNVHRKDEGQDAFEYLLVVGGLSVAIVVAAIVLADGTPGIVTDVQALIDGVLD